MREIYGEGQGECWAEETGSMTKGHDIMSPVGRDRDKRMAVNKHLLVLVHARGGHENRSFFGAT